MGPAGAAAEARGRLERQLEEYEGGARYKAEIRRNAEEALGLVEGYEATREAELAAVRAEFAREVDRERQKAAEAEAALEAARRSLDARRPAMGLQRVEDGNMIVFPRPEPEKSYEKPRPWQLSEVESICYDLRLCGADDWTPVPFDDKATSALVPYPEAVAGGLGSFRYGDGKPEPGEAPRALIDEPVTRQLKAMLAIGVASLAAVVLIFGLPNWLGLACR